MVDMNRIFQNLTFTVPSRKRMFPDNVLTEIANAIKTSELDHSGEIRIAIEGTLDVSQILRGMSARDRAVQLFSELRVWDTSENTGVLLYVLLAERDVEIVADRGITGKVSQDNWDRICRSMEASFKEGRFRDGVVAAVEAINSLLAEHFPETGGGVNELPNEPIVLR